MKNALDFATNKWRVNFYVFISGQFLTRITSDVVSFALVWQVVKETNSATMLAMTTLVFLLPLILLTPFVGPLVDRMNKKFLIIVPDIVLAALAGVLMAVGYFAKIPLELIFIMLFLRGLAGAFQHPALSSINPTIVPSDFITKAAGQTSMVNSISYLIAPALAALVFDFMPLYAIISLDILGAVVGTIFTLIVTIPSFKKDAKQHFIKDAKEGLATLRMHKGIFRMVILIAIYHIFLSPVSAMYPLITTDYFGGTFAQVGIVETLWAAGTILGSLVIGAVGAGKDRIRTVAICLIVFGALFLPTAFFPPNFDGYIQFSILNFFAGAVCIGCDVPIEAILQSKYPPEKLGAVIGVSGSIMRITSPIGLLLVGPIVDLIGVQTILTAIGVIILIYSLFYWLVPSIRWIDRDVPDYSELT
ncbi:MAG: MFS transporter [Bifidobacteriaceae bacterium]|jgi:DHA3 family macrolide efflux protein-like MFS transporter|nr:MFS transporter [Bifidobacteriaceae bacterium]